jgi:hypothetical protein
MVIFGYLSGHLPLNQGVPGHLLISSMAYKAPRRCPRGVVQFVMAFSMNTGFFDDLAEDALDKGSVEGFFLVRSGPPVRSAWCCPCVSILKTSLFKNVTF